MKKFTGDARFYEEIMADEIDFDAEFFQDKTRSIEDETETDFAAAQAEQDARREIMAR